MAELALSPGLRPDIASQVTQLWETWHVIVPSWLQKLSVSYDSGLDVTAQISISDEYRTADLRLGPEWHNVETDQERLFVHELAHLYNVPISREARESLEDIIGADYPTPGSKVAERNIVKALERCNSDLTDLIMQLANQ